MNKILLLAVLFLFTTNLHSQSQYDSLRKVFIKTDSICDCNGLFELDSSYTNLSNLPNSIELFDLIKSAQNKSLRKFFYEDSLTTYELNYVPRKNDVRKYVYIYYKQFNVIHFLTYNDKNTLKRTYYKFKPASVGPYIEFDSLGLVEKSENRNYVFYGNKKSIKRKYPICWREAYELAKLKEGITQTNEYHTISRSGTKPGYWIVTLGDKIILGNRINAKNGKCID